MAGPSAWVLVSQVLAQDGNLSATLDSIVLGLAYSGHPAPVLVHGNGQRAVDELLRSPITQPREIGNAASG